MRRSEGEEEVHRPQVPASLLTLAPEREPVPRQPDAIPPYQVQRLETLCQGYIGRNGLEEQVEKWFSSRQSGVLLLTGREGCGKSALMARLARTHDAAYYFLSRRPAEGSASACFSSLIGQLSRRFLASGTPTPCSPRSQARTLWRQCSSILASRKRLVLVLDGLDEAALASPGLPVHRLLLQEPPAGLVLLLSCGAGSPEGDLVGRELPCRETTMLEVPALSPTEARRWLDEMVQGEAALPDRFAGEAVAASAGLPLYLAGLVEQVQAGLVDVSLPAPAGATPGESLEALWLNLWTGLDRKGLRRFRQILALLATAREALTIESLEHLLGVGMESFRRSVLATCVSGSDPCEVRHDTLRQLVTAKVDATERQRLNARLADHYGDWREAADDRSLAHRAIHLVEAGDRDGLHRLLTDFDYLKAKVDRLGVEAVLADFQAYVDRSGSKGPPPRQAGDPVEVIADAVQKKSRWIEDRPEELGPYVRDELFLAGRVGGVAPTLLREVSAWIARARREPWLRRVEPGERAARATSAAAIDHAAGAIASVAWSPDGTRILTGGRDRLLTIWDARTGGAVRTLSVSSTGSRRFLTMRPWRSAPDHGRLRRTT
ncbi:MAG: AAA family ATPase [Candidatus Riflebacteria bacterium]|nr:AAA family ATPase [Candidatus Riflebacteria bacterium]